MRNPMLATVPLTLAAILAGCNGAAAAPSTPSPSPTVAAASPAPGPVKLAARGIASGLQFPLLLVSPPGDRERLFVLEQPGRVRVIQGDTLLPAPFLDLTAKISSGGERGLLGLAFHPQYAANGRFFVNYTDLSGNTQVSELRVSAQDANRADPASEKTVLQQVQPFANHNGGDLKFGPDGKLYITLGDGGSGGDPQGNGQNLGTWLGKLLRIDVDAGSPYAVPPDNPFVSRAGARGEIWAYGLRNPWRIAFDRANGDLYIADVGQNQFEEVHVEAAPRRGGQNYGWNVTEGNHCFKDAACNLAAFIPAVLEYTHAVGCSITGGHVYRGDAIPALRGHYFYADYCTAIIRSFRFADGRATEQTDWTTQINASLGTPIAAISSFGEDTAGELYILEHDSTNGKVYRIIPSP